MKKYIRIVFNDKHKVSYTPIENDCKDIKSFEKECFKLINNFYDKIKGEYPCNFKPAYFSPLHFTPKQCIEIYEDFQIKPVIHIRFELIGKRKSKNKSLLMIMRAEPLNEDI